jgi:hypothetical protein
VIRKPPSKMVPKRGLLKLRITHEKDQQEFICKECNENFHTGQALGGHMSRVHPGQSSSYARKLQRRDERVLDREFLRFAKIMHAEQAEKGAPLDRVKIRRFKKMIRQAVMRGERYIEGLSVPLELK